MRAESLEPRARSRATRRLRKRTAVALLIAALIAQPARAELSEPSEARYLAGLRERQLFALAESYCRRRLEQAYTVDRRRAELTVELSRTALEAALFTKPPEREARFSAALKVLSDEQQRKPNSAWKPLLLVQGGVVELVWGERLREEAQTLNSGDAALEKAREHLRAAAALFKQVDELAAAGAQDAARRQGAGAAGEQPSITEWASLRRQIDYQRARTQRNFGESYPGGSPDRLSALEQAVELLEALSRAELTDAITWQARLDEATCRRLLGDLNKSELVLNLLDGQSPPTEIADRARAQRIRNRIVARKLEDAQQYFKPQDTEPDGAADPEVRLAETEWLVASARAADEAKNAQAAADFRERAAAMARLIAERHTPYFARRAETLLATSIGASPSAVHDDGALAKAAESFYRQGNIDKALELYDQIFTQATAAKQADVAFNAAFTAAALEQQRSRFATAADRFEKLAVALPDHARAGEASLLAAFNLGQSLAGVTDVAAATAGIERYAVLLKAHIARRPTDRTTPQARLWLAKVHLQRREPREVVSLLRGVSASDLLAEQIVAVLQQAGDAELAAGKTAADRAAIAEVYAAALDGVRATSDAAAPSPVARLALRAAARLRLIYGEAGFATAAESLSQLLKATDLPADERRALLAWLALAEAGAGRLESAKQHAAAIDGSLTAEALPVVAKLDALAARAAVDQRDALATLVLRFVELLQPHQAELPAAWIAQVAPAEARALSHLGRIAEARKVWDALAAQRPRDAVVQEGYAAFLLTQSDRESLTRAVERWRLLERATREASPEWYRARLGTAQAYAKLGDSARAREIVELTAALHPDLGGPELRRRFEALVGPK
jgi:hypothetical protein